MNNYNMKLKKLKDQAKLNGFKYENGDFIHINKENITVSEEDVMKFKNIFKLLCKNGNIKFKLKKYIEKEETHWDRDGIGTSRVDRYIKLSLSIDNKEILSTKCNLNE